MKIIRARDIRVQDIIVSKDFYLCLYPNKAMADEAVNHGGGPAIGGWSVGDTSVIFWSQRLNCCVQIINPGDNLFVVARDGDYLKVIGPQDKWGWIIFAYWLNLQNYVLAQEP